MLAVTDYVGISALVTSIGTIVIGVIVAWRQSNIKGTVEDTHRAVQMSNGTTLGQVIEGTEKLRTDAGGAPLPIPPPPEAA